MMRSLLNKKETEQNGPCYEKGMASTPLPVRPWEAKKILFSARSKKGWSPPLPPSQSAKHHQKDNTSALGRAITQEEE
jgi:hypothetical protein